MMKVFRNRSYIGKKKKIQRNEPSSQTVSSLPKAIESPSLSSTLSTCDTSEYTSSIRSVESSLIPSGSEMKMIQQNERDEISGTDCSRAPPLKDQDSSEQPKNKSPSDAIGNDDACLTMVVYRSRHPVPPPLPESVNAFLQAADALMKTKEMKNLISCSCDVIGSASGLVLHVAFLPVTIPVRAITSTTNMVVGTAGLVVGTAGAVVGNTGAMLQSIVTDTSNSDSSCSGQSTSSRPPLEGLVHNVTNVIPFLFHAAGQITMGLGTTAVHLVAPVLGVGNMDDGCRQSDGTVNSSSENDGGGISWNNSSTGESSAEHDSFLDRLRLDITVPSNPATDLPSNSSMAGSVRTQQVSGHYGPYSPRGRVSAADISKHLLRVDDLAVEIENDPTSSTEQHYPAGAVLYIDLSRDFADEFLTTQALRQLVSRGLQTISSNRFVQFEANQRPEDHQLPSFRVDWKAEGSTTSKLIRKLEKQSSSSSNDSESWSRKLETTIGIWSGVYRGPKHYGSDNPLFLARGIVKMSPRTLLNLLWDSSRTSEYNNYCLGRTDVIILEDDILQGGTYGAKVIRSETKVPFTGMSVVLSVLMHAKAIHCDGDNEESFVIVSRSLDAGTAGCHIGTTDRVEKGSNKNEILLGMNFMRSVPDNPGWTDLACLSQVNSALVPSFLAKRIGMMGVEDFFNNIRSLAS